MSCEKRKKQLKSKAAIIFVVLLLLAIIIELLFFVCGTSFDFSDDAISVYKDNSENIEIRGFRQEGNEFFPESNDPQIIISGINQNIKTLLIKFGAANYAEKNVQVFFKKKSDNFFSEENSSTVTMPEKAKYVAIDLPLGDYDSIRIDINGKFVIDDIIISSGEINGTAFRFVNPFSFFRFFIIFVILLTIFVLSFSIREWCRKSNCKAYVIFSKAHEFIINRPVIMLVLLLISSSFIIFFNFLTKREIFIYSDIGSDTINIYYPFFMSMQRKLENFDLSLWDFSYGLGANMIGRQPDIASPFVWFTIMFGKDNVKYLLPYAQILKIIFSGVVCYFYLDNFNLSKKSKILFSYAFAFNGFTVIWGQHYFFATASLCAALVLLGIERCLKKSAIGGFWLAIAVFYTAVSSYYFAYMILITAVIYALIRLTYLHTKKDFPKAIKKGCKMIGFVFLGLGMSAVTFLPAAYGILTSSNRVNNGTSIFETLCNYAGMPCYDSSVIKEIIAKLFSSNLCGVANGFVGVSNYYESPHFFFTSFLLFFAFIFFLNIFIDRRSTLKASILKLVSFLLILYLLIHPFLSVILNGFVSNFFRYTYVLMPLFAWMCSYIFDKISKNELKLPRLQITASATLSIFLLAKISLENANDYTAGIAPVYITMILLVAFVMLFLQDKDFSHSFKRIGIFSICAIIITNVAVDSYISTNSRTTISESNITIYSESGNVNVAKALEYIEEIDPSFHRVDKTFFDVCLWNDAMLEGYYGVSVYNSGVNKNVIDFVDKICPELKSKFPYTDGYYDFTAAYQNVQAATIMGVKYILSNNFITDIPEYEYLASFSDIHLYRNNKSTGIGRFYANAISYESFITLTKSEKDSVLENTIVLDEIESNTINNNTAEYSVYFEKPENSSYIEGTLLTSENGWLMISIPYEDGWKAYIDGIETDIMRGDVGFSAIKVSAGEHNITFKYRTPLIIPATVISIISTAIFAVFLSVTIIRLKKQNSTNNESSNSV